MTRGPPSRPVAALDHFELVPLDVDLEEFDRPTGRDMLLADLGQGQDRNVILDDLVGLGSEIAREQVAVDRPAGVGGLIKGEVPFVVRDPDVEVDIALANRLDLGERDRVGLDIDPPPTPLRRSAA